MLFLFRTNQIVYSLLLLIYAIVLRLSYFLNPPVKDMANDGILSVFTKNWVGENHFTIGIITIIIVFLQAILINNLTTKYRLFNESTLFPGLFYILAVSSLQDFLPLSSILVGNTFLILALTSLLGIYKTPKCADTIFNVGFWIGMAALFYNAFTLFFLLAVVGLLTLRSFKVKEFFMVVCGYVLPFLFASVYFFWFDQYQDYWNTYFFQQFSWIDFRLGAGWNRNYKLIILLVLITMGILNGYKFNKSSKIRDYMNILYIGLFISGLTFLFQQNIQFSHFLIIMTPLSILLAARFLSMSKTAAEFVHLFLFIGIMLFQFNVFQL